jgi:uncharacterized membrane protein YfcA
VIEVVLIGLAAGVASGLLGVGGGILFVPALVLLFDSTQLAAQGTSLLAIVPAALVGAARQHSYGNARLREGVVIGALSAFGLSVGLRLANAAPERLLEVGFAGLLLLTAFQLVRRAWSERPVRSPRPRTRRPRLAHVFGDWRRAPTRDLAGVAAPRRTNKLLWQLLGW